jgi:hypothetical protein
MERQTGITTKQMQNAPKGAVYVWCNSVLGYPRDLAKKIERTDLEIVSPHWLTDQRWRGRSLTGLELDHTCRLDEREYQSFEDALTRIKR